MKIKFTLLLFTIVSALSARSQTGTVCANNFGFSSAIFLDPAAVSGCQNINACTGTAVLYDLRPACEPAETMDGCAPAPAHTLQQNGYDLWWKFIANGSTAKIAVNPGMTLNVGIQVLSGSACGALTEVASLGGLGENVSAALNLSGLIPGRLYYFRVFGSSDINAQRYGDICFCGSQNISGPVIPNNILTFSATGKYKIVNIHWTISSLTDAKLFEIQRSIDGVNFTTVRTVNASGKTYEYIDQPSVNRIFSYRLKSTGITGDIEYSETVPVNLIGKSSLLIYPNLVNGSSFIVESNDKVMVNIFNTTGINISGKQLMPGQNNIDASMLTNGIYFLQNTATGEILKFIVSK